MSHCGLYRTEGHNRGRTDNRPERLAEAREHAWQRTAATGRDAAQTTKLIMRGIQLHEVFQAPNVQAKRLPEAVRLSDGLDAGTHEPLRTLLNRGPQPRTNRRPAGTAD